LGKRDDAQLFGQSRTLRIKQLLGLDGSMANSRSRRSQHRHSAQSHDFHSLSRACRPSRNQLRNRPVWWPGFSRVGTSWTGGCDGWRSCGGRR